MSAAAVALDRLAAAVDALAAERDALRDALRDRVALHVRDIYQAHDENTVLKAETAVLLDRIARATAELDRAQEADPDKPNKRAMREVMRANTFAWTVLAEGHDPPSVRRAEGAP